MGDPLNHFSECCFLPPSIWRGFSEVPTKWTSHGCFPRLDPQHPIKDFHSFGGASSSSREPLDLPPESRQLQSPQGCLWAHPSPALAAQQRSGAGPFLSAGPSHRPGEPLGLAAPPTGPSGPRPCFRPPPAPPPHSGRLGRRRGAQQTEATQRP